MNNYSISMSFCFFQIFYILFYIPFYRGQLCYGYSHEISFKCELLSFAKRNRAYDCVSKS
jgi:hypothetical protein